MLGRHLGSVPLGSGLQVRGLRSWLPPEGVARRGQGESGAGPGARGSPHAAAAQPPRPPVHNVAESPWGWDFCLLPARRASSGGSPGAKPRDTGAGVWVRPRGLRPRRTPAPLPAAARPRPPSPATTVRWA